MSFIERIWIMDASNESSFEMVQLALTSDTEELAKVRPVVSRAAVQIGFDEHTVGQIALAIDEALANVIRHGYGNQQGQPIDVTIEQVQWDARPALQVIICDCGRQVDPETITGRDLNEVRPGGLGTHIIRTIMTEVQYECRQPSGMKIRMVKVLPEAGENETLERDSS